MASQIAFWEPRRIGTVVCAMRQTENHPRLIATQQRVAGCECFNYCGHRFGNCCNFDEPDCALNCVGGIQLGELAKHIFKTLWLILTRRPFDP
jgi:hypothetical protein